MSDINEKEAKRSQVVHGVYKIGDQYFCAQCDTLLEYGKSCPKCLTRFDWEAIRVALKP